MTEPLPVSAPKPSSGWGRVLGYFVVFFASMTLMGVVFTLGGIAIIVLPGSLTIWGDVAYIAVSVAVMVLVSLTVANRVFRAGAPTRGDGAGAAAPARARPSLLGWIAGIAGAVISAGLSALVVRLIER
jgi:hypothetical protein